MGEVNLRCRAIGAVAQVDRTANCVYDLINGNRLGRTEADRELAKHGLDFATLTEAFFANAKVLAAKGGRYQAIGMDVNGVISVVFVVLGLEGISVISMRPASRKERKLFNA